MFSEGSLLPTGASNLETERSQRGGKVRGCQELTGKGGGGRSGIFARGINSRYIDVTLRESGGTSVHVGKISVAGTTYRSSIVQVTPRDRV